MERGRPDRSFASQYRFAAFVQPRASTAIVGSSLFEGFTGVWNKKLDTTTGLIEMGARPYDPGLGRFLAVDPVDGGSANAYDYAAQDPVNAYDLDGRSVYTDQNDDCLSWKCRNPDQYFVSPNSNPITGAISAIGGTLKAALAKAGEGKVESAKAQRALGEAAVPYARRCLTGVGIALFGEWAESRLPRTAPSPLARYPAWQVKAVAAAFGCASGVAPNAYGD